MSARTCPAVLVSAPASGQGKTLVTAALARAWRNRGLTVQAFKCGPDFIDSMILQVATGRPVYNLDLGMCGLADAQAQLYHAKQHADVIIAEGVMGLYDGTPSTADIAKAFNLPVALVIDASGMAQTFAAVAHGLYDFEPSLLRAGVIANKVGSTGHATMLKDAISNSTNRAHPSNQNTPWLGALLKDAQFSLPERHLGLHLAHEISDIEQRIEAAAQILGADLPLPPMVSFAAPEVQAPPLLLEGKTIAVARDAAFCFIYPANIDCLKAMGANVIYFSALDDVALPEADAYWIPGGYPELHLERIQQNTCMQTSLKAAKQAGKPILAECGGMMALGQRINGSPTFDVIAGESTMQAKLQGLGTQHLTTPQGIIGAHTFHYGQFQTPLPPAHVANSKYRQGEAVYVDGSVTVSFLHFYFPSNPIMAAQFFLS
jgi:cobyrinic acid a,c-diamide synthase